MPPLIPLTVRRAIRLYLLAQLALFPAMAQAQEAQLGPRPFHLVDAMEDGSLKDKLEACMSGPFARSDWSIGHRGAALQFPEHTEQSYRAAARMGAGIVECDVTFTRDRELVCRHAQDDLHTTTNILATDLAASCVKPFSPASGSSRASAECRTSEIALAEFRTLRGKMDAANPEAQTVAEYLDGTPDFRTDLYAGEGTLMTHAESIALFRELDVKFTPELKAPAVAMPFEGDYTREIYAQQMIDEYKAAGIDPGDVYPQSFRLEDVLYWIRNEPEFGRQAVWLDGSYANPGWLPANPSTWAHSMADLKAMGVNIIAPPIWVLITMQNGRIVPSAYAEAARAAGLDIIAWTAERSGPLDSGGGWYFQSVSELIDNDGDIYEVMHVLHADIGVIGLFSDWPATTTFYANCFGLGLRNANDE